MAVGIGRHPDRGVPKQLHDGPQLLPLVEQERGEGVPQVVQVQPIQPGRRVSELYAQVNTGNFSVLVGTQYEPGTNEPRQVELLTPLHQLEEA